VAKDGDIWRNFEAIRGNTEANTIKITINACDRARVTPPELRVQP